MSQQQNIKSNQQAKRTTVKKQDSSFHALLYELTLEEVQSPYYGLYWSALGFHDTGEDKSLRPLSLDMTPSHHEDLVNSMDCPSNR
ncbi:hypothetical protein H671_1g3073 [Cricetulus griseus]|uniref:Uncharacterized protein n=1 Tax=Cricetulus griseus TaxID=10029 RepID=A0A061IMB4_CRIGR|nr:hypothetical protein H671_1g3073 [Cricetulus griseus]